jgi:recombining binding protein (suppressor of hairless)
MEDRSQQVLQSIWDARVQIGSTTSYWPPKLSNVTTIRCMYANIAQKSYGTEKRFLCPPPVVKISGPLRPCKWVTMRVTLGDSALGPSNSTRGVGSSGALGSTAGGEEQAILDANAEARFGKLHVGSVSDASSKVFRLQINLLRAESITDDAKGGVQRAIQEMGGPLNLPTHAWATFHSSPINVISKPARKSVRTRAASPAIASGSVVCLYNRLNSQTVRTKYLGVEAGSISDVGEHVQVARKLIARQEGWEGFSIELLARPLHDPAVARVKLRGASSEEWGITYGSIVCLRDVNSKLCSDPMLICKVDKGRVELSSVTGDTTGTNKGKVRFQIVSKNRQEALDILFGGSRKWTGDATAAWPSPKVGDSSETQKLDRGHREGSQASSSNNGGSPALADADKASSVPTANATTTTTTTAAAAADASGSMGGPVIQMQKVTLMHVVPKPSTHSADEIECDLSTPRAYLCSTASDGQRDGPIQPVLARSKRRMQVRSEAVLGNEIDGEHVLDEADAPVDASPRPHGKGASGGDMPMATQGTTSATSSVQSSMVGFTCPPTATANDAGSSGQVDFLEDQFCWTIVTISCTEVSFIDANSPADGSSAYPHLPCSPLPVTPFPCLAAQPTYDPRSHAISATIHDFLLADGLDGGRHLFNTVSAVHAVPNKVAHDVWLAHSGPLSAHVSSAGPYMSDVTVQLPGMDKLAGLHAELYGLPSTTSIEQINVIQLPLLFVRLAQGVTFPSGHWLLAERNNAGHRHGGHTASAWTIRVI